MALKLIAPGARRGNPFYLVRGMLNGREFEVSTKTTDAGVAQKIAQDFEAGITGETPHAESLILSDSAALRELVYDAVRDITVSIDRITAAGSTADVGIYFLFDRDSLRYIGHSSNIKRRVQFHREEKRIPFDAWTAIATPHDLLEIVEAAYILRYQPFFNRGPQKRRSRAKSGE